MEVRRAERRKSKLRLGLVGPSGSGKTLSSLFLAYGITGDWDRVGLVDTEEGSGEQYEGTTKSGVQVGSYLYVRLEPPFTPKRYIQAIEALEAAGAEAVIIDSLSHAWAGTGGILDMKDKAAGHGGNSYTAWRNVTPEHNALVDKLIRSPKHVIACMRAKTEYVVEQDDKGKAVPRKVGLAPVQRDGMEYEFTVVLDVAMNHSVTSSKDRTGLFDGQYMTITPETGQMLLNWLATGKELEPAATPVVTPPKPESTPALAPPGPTVPPPAPKNPEAIIGKAEVATLLSIAAEKKWTNEAAAKLLERHGYANSKLVKRKDFAAICAELKKGPAPFESGTAPPVTPAAPSTDELRQRIDNMVGEMADWDIVVAQSILESLTAFTGSDGAQVAGVRTTAALSDKRVPPSYGKVKIEYQTWQSKREGVAS